MAGSPRRASVSRHASRNGSAPRPRRGHSVTGPRRGAWPDARREPAPGPTRSGIREAAGRRARLWPAKSTQGARTCSASATEGVVMRTVRRAEFADRPLIERTTHEGRIAWNGFLERPVPVGDGHVRTRGYLWKPAGLEPPRGSIVPPVSFGASTGDLARGLPRPTPRRAVRCGDGAGTTGAPESPGAQQSRDVSPRGRKAGTAVRCRGRISGRAGETKAHQWSAPARPCAARGGRPGGRTVRCRARSPFVAYLLLLGAVCGERTERERGGAQADRGLGLAGSKQSSEDHRHRAVARLAGGRTTQSRAQTECSSRRGGWKTAVDVAPRAPPAVRRAEW